MEKRLTARIRSIEPGAIKGQRIVEASYEGGSLKFDLIGDLLEVGEGDVIEIVITDSKPEDLDPYQFCGRGYLVPSGGGKEIFSVWGILFRFEPGLGLEVDREYFLCIKR
ncbi:MAG: DNA-directed RNA polymerase subunit G [Desulfurococcales archaeon]|nr:DNA-directed RNA polymerase subunit G [Desulfurococcales archaeon]MCE4605365.1 DNA-directed RNA polymerase subunit G [Desulfurococcales archaeon]